MVAFQSNLFELNLFVSLSYWIREKNLQADVIKKILIEKNALNELKEKTVL